VIAPKGISVGAQLLSGAEAPIKAGNALPLRNIPVGTIVALRGDDARQRRADLALGGVARPGARREGSYAQLRLRSGEDPQGSSRLPGATFGEVGNEEHNLESIGKAGRKRWRGIRPTVRGVAMNPIDHPHGGGEGRTAGPRSPRFRPGACRAKATRPAATSARRS